MDFKLFGKCVGCRLNKWFIRKRTVTTPIGLTAKSKDLICKKCYTKLQDKLNSN